MRVFVFLILLSILTFCSFPFLSRMRPYPEIYKERHGKEFPKHGNSDKYLNLSIYLDKNTYLEDETIYLDIVLKNISDRDTIYIEDIDLDNIVCKDTSGKLIRHNIISTNHVDWISITDEYGRYLGTYYQRGKPLAPQDSVKRSLNMLRKIGKRKIKDKLLDYTYAINNLIESGSYSIWFTHPHVLVDSIGKSNGKTITSNKISFKIIKPEGEFLNKKSDFYKIVDMINENVSFDEVKSQCSEFLQKYDNSVYHYYVMIISNSPEMYDDRINK